MLSARIGADFSQFVNALGEVQVKVKSSADLAKNTGRDFDRLVAAFDGTKVQRDAQVMVAAIEKLGGAGKLTAAEQARVNTTVQEAIAKYRALGQQAPLEMQKLADATKQAAVHQQSLTDSIKASAAGYLAGMATFEGAKRILGGIADFATSLVDAYAEEEAAVKRLSAALMAQGEVGPEVIEQYQGIAEALSQTTANSKDAILGVEGLLVTIGEATPANMRRATMAVADLSAALGIDLDSASRMVGKAMEGNVAALKKAGIQINAAAVEAGGLEVVLGAIEARVGGQAQAQLATYAGQVKHLANQFEEAKEAAGGLIVNESALSGWIKLANGALAVARKETGDSTLSWEKLARTLFDLTGSPIDPFLRENANLVNHWTAEVARAEGAWKRFVGASGIEARRIGPLGMGPAEDALKKYDEESKAAALAAKKAQDDLAAAAKKHAESVSKYWDEIDKLTASSGKMMAGWNDEILAKNKAAAAFWTQDWQQAQKDLAALMRDSGKMMADWNAEILAKNKAGVDAWVQDWLKGEKQKKVDWAAFEQGAVDAFNGIAIAAERAGSAIVASMASGGAAITKLTSKTVTMGEAVNALSLIAVMLVDLFDTMYPASDFAARRTAFIAAAGGLRALNDEAIKAGTSVEKLLRASTRIEYVRAERELTAALAVLDLQNKKLADQVELQKSIADMQAQLDAARSAAMPTWDKISAIAEKYGIDIERAGRGVQQLMVNASATSLLNEWQQWSKVGGDLDIFAKASASSFSTLVQQARLFGTTLPENMQPTLQSLIDQGRLLDKAGQKIADLSGLTFGGAIQTDQEKLAAEFDRLTLALQGLTTQLAILAGHPPVVVAAIAAGAGAFLAGASNGRSAEYAGRQALGGDYFVTRPTLFLAGEAGPERATFSPGGGGGGSVTINVRVDAVDVGSFRAWLRSGASREIADAIVPHFGQRVNFRVGS